MRKKIYEAGYLDGLAVLRRAKTIELAGVGKDGRPVLRTVHPIVREPYVWFHSAVQGEKTSLVGTPVVLQAQEVVARIPSYFVDPQRACPATTYYRSAQVKGVLEPVEDLQEKAGALEALMEEYQGEGGYITIEANHPLYQKALEKLLVCRVSMDSVTAKYKLGQNRSPAQMGRMLAQLWQRGSEEDIRAIEILREAHSGAEIPAFLRCPPGVTAVCDLATFEAHSEVLGLLRGAYWTQQRTEAQSRQAWEQSNARVGLRATESGELIAAARAVSDGAVRAWVYDVIVHPQWRNRGLGRRLMELLLDHPRVRHAQSVGLGTRNATGFYQSFGFVELEPSGAQPTIPMVLRRTSLCAKTTPRAD